MKSLSRRDLIRLSALTLAATRLPAQTAPVKPVGYAAVGLGRISDIFMRACASAPSAKITALVTGHADSKGARYAAQYGIPMSSIYTYETFDRIKDNPAVDAVYLGLPNSMHAEYTLRAAAAGKHVLCEKPMAISVNECRQMIDACRRANRLLMIAYRCHYDPTFLEADRLIRSGAIGKLQSFEGAFGFNQTLGEWRLNKALSGGGALLDVGIYPLNAVRFFTHAEPVHFTAAAVTPDAGDPRFREVEETLNWTMQMSSGATASLATTYGGSMPGFLRINGEKATLELSPAFNYTSTHLQNLGGSHLHVDTTSSPLETAQFTLQAEHFAQCIRTNQQPATPGEEGLQDMIAIEAIYRAAAHTLKS